LAVSSEPTRIIRSQIQIEAAFLQRLRAWAFVVAALLAPGPNGGPTRGDMRIETPENFYHAGNLPARFASNDPRQDVFREQAVEIDMRGCQFVGPAAVLWCGVYPLLVVSKGSKCRLLVPQNMGVCVYLQSVGLFALLQKAGVEVDDRGIAKRPDRQVVLPLTRFEATGEVEDLANEALDSLRESGLGASNVYFLVTEIFAELAQNAVQHSQSRVHALGFIQFYESKHGRRFVCAVADGGIGIRRALEMNPALRDRVAYDWDAIELALRERVSGTGGATRGIGLYGVAEDMKRPGRHLIIHSGQGMLETREDVQTSSRRVNLFPGTLATASITT
jgi:hypothetical protein